MRLRRQRLVVRAFRKRRELTCALDRTAAIRAGDILAFTTLRNEKLRLPYFLDYYREHGVNHFLMVDNDSDDGVRDYLATQPDVSLWTTPASYRRARFGVDWLNALARQYGFRHWCLTVDPDEFLVYPFCDTRPIGALTDWLDACGQIAYPAMLLDMYPKGPIDTVPYAEGQDPLEIANWFDSGNYTLSHNPEYHNLWIQGGPRARVFFPNAPSSAPSLNKIPLVKWHRHYAYVDSTHMLLPRRLNHVYDQRGGEMPAGALLHTKFLHTLTEKTQEEMSRHQHYAGSREYRAYQAVSGGTAPDLWCRWSERYINWRQLEILGLISKGNWA
jgi:hypothetical protein